MIPWAVMETGCRQPSRGPLPCQHVTSRCDTSQPMRLHPEIDELAPWWKRYTKKYIILCLTCGSLSILLGAVFIVIYFILRSYTSSLQFFETIPTYVPAVVLVITGLIVMSFAKRRNRYAYLVKLAGGCCLICALLCVIITVTTTVVHMNRLQTLHECVYTPKVKTCMCVSAIVDSSEQDGTHRFVFNNTPNCEVVHGSLSICLRVLFGLSVVGILVCIFSSMLIYQLLTHEKKKVYLEQLELRRRFLYRQRSQQQQGFCNYCEEPWQLWEMLDSGTHRRMDESTPRRRRRRRWGWWPWNVRLRSASVSNRDRSAGSGISHSSRESPSVSPGIYGNRNSQSVRFGPRTTGRHWHRRTRSNDGVFHHLHFAIPHYGAQAAPFSSAGEVPRYMWGPPPPYSHPPSVENIAVPVELTSYCRGETEAIDSETQSSKNTPTSGRHFLCNRFASERRKSEDEPCVVHVPGCVFNTLPTRSSRKRIEESNPFKSLSNIPLCLSRKLSGLKDPTLSLIETCYSYDVGDEMFRELTRLRMFVRPPSSATLSEEERSMVTETTTQSSVGSFPATILELPSDFRSSIVIATSPSTDDDRADVMTYAQSMPNLNVSNSISICVPSGMPSSGSDGNTSTSQDFADFELDDDGSLAGIPECCCIEKHEQGHPSPNHNFPS